MLWQIRIGIFGIVLVYHIEMKIKCEWDNINKGKINNMKTFPLSPQQQQQQECEGMRKRLIGKN